jgi:hypothetical protein
LGLADDDGVLPVGAFPLEPAPVGASPLLGFFPCAGPPPPSAPSAPFDAFTPCLAKQASKADEEVAFVAAEAVPLGITSLTYKTGRLTSAIAATVRNQRRDEITP